MLNQKMINKLRFAYGMAIVTATADFHPLRQIHQLSTDIKAHNFEGIVLFDLLAVNGLAPNRFVSMRFNATGFDRSSFEVTSKINAVILKEQNQNAKNDPVFLTKSVLSSSEVRQFACRP